MRNVKKILFLGVFILIALSVSACSLNKTNSTNSEQEKQIINSGQAINETNTPTTGINTQDNNNSLNLDASTSSEAISSSTPKEIISVEPAAKNNNMINPENFESLTAKYSSAIIKTSLGDIKVKFYANESPYTVNNFLNLAKLNFYNGVKFHRIIKDFMIQVGDPLSKGDDTTLYGTGGPGYSFKDEFNNHKLVAGSLAMANSGSDTNGSQFFIVTAAATSWLDGKHTNFGEVVSGMDVVKKIEAAETNARDLPLTPITINSIELLK
jgi:cyclophilin family peptidyl-prolyl cis-trans isomerase